MSKKLSGISEALKLVLISTSGKVGVGILAVLGAIAILAPVIAPYNPWEYGEFKPYLPPSKEHLLGTNDVGVDIFSELLYGARVSLLIGILAGILSVSVGTLVGLIGGFYGGIVRTIAMRITDLFLIMPAIPLAILLAAVTKPSIINIVIVIMVVSWPAMARQIYAQTLSLREELYVEAAEALGVPNTRIMLKHILPNLYPLVIANMILMAGNAMLIEAGLSFLGLGDPTQKSWGMMLFYAQMSGAFSRKMWWWLVPPGILIGIAILGFTLLGQALEEALSPRLRQQ